MRCLAFAETLDWASWDVEFISSEETGLTAPAIALAGIPIRNANAASLHPSTADLSVFDNYDMCANDERRLGASSRHRLAFDDMPSRMHDVHVLVDPTPGRSATDYDNCLMHPGLVLAGAPYFQLRRTWQACRSAISPRNRRIFRHGRILVSMGATDPDNATVKVLQAISSSGLDADVEVVLGAGAPHLPGVRAALGPRTRLHIEPTNFPALVSEADIAIGAAGSSCFERAHLGLPSIIIVLAPNQVQLAAAFQRAGAAWLAEKSDLDHAETLGGMIRKLAESSEAQFALSEAGMHLVDGRGPQRLLVAMGGPSLNHANRISMRLVEKSDMEWLFELQSQSETRQFSNNTRPPSVSEHTAWFARTLNDADRLLAILECDGAASGFVRLDRLTSEPRSFEVSIAVAPGLKGRGIAGTALHMLRGMIPKADLIASILPQNAASQALFGRAGYRREGETRYRQCVA